MIHKIILIIASLTLFALSAFSQGEWPYMKDSYDKQACAAVYSPTSACNKGAEPFSKFITKFCKSRDFRKSRITAEEYIVEVFTNPDYTKSSSSMFSVCRPTKKNGYWLRTWQHVSANSVWYVAGYMPPFQDDDTGITATYHFVRKDGKWYLTEGVII